MRISSDFIAALKDRIGMEELVSAYMPLKRTGSNLMGLCPFHGEKTPSFSVSPEKGFFHCFGCGAGGDMITFVMMIERVEYLEAVRILAERAGVPMPDEGIDDSYARLKTRIYEINRETARFFNKQLSTAAGRPALDYLRGRALSDNTIRKFGIGYSPDGWQHLLNHLTGLGFQENEIFSANLCGKSSKTGRYYDFFRGRVMFPIFDQRNNVIAFGGRKLPDAEGPKYINSSDTPVYKKGETLYALNFRSGDRGLILVEGYMDVIALHQAGFGSAVAALGTAFTLEQARLAARNSEELMVTLDADSAGAKATDRVMDVCRQIGLPVRILRVPDGKDPDEFLRMRGGPERFGALLDGAASDVDYRLLTLKAGIDIDTTEGTATYIRRCIEVLATLDPIAMELYAGRLADTYKIAKSAILAETKAFKRKSENAGKKRLLQKTVNDTMRVDKLNPDASAHRRAAAAEETLLCVFMNHSGQLERFSELTPGHFITELNRRIFAAVKNICEQNRQFEFSMLSQDFSPAEMGRIIHIASMAHSFESLSKTVNDCIGVLETEKQLDSPGTDTDDWEQKMKLLRDKSRKV